MPEASALARVSICIDDEGEDDELAVATPPAGKPVPVSVSEVPQVPAMSTGATVRVGAISIDESAVIPPCGKADAE